MPSAADAAASVTHPVVATPRGLQAARRFVVETMQQWAVDARTANAALDVANELVSNAVRHGAPPSSLRLDLDRETAAVTVVVTDSSPEPAQLLPYRAGISERGLGMRLVVQLSVAWGQRPDSDGKVVWARVTPRRPPG